MESSADLHRPHRTSSINTSSSNSASTPTGELFICFTSRPSSSMKLPSSKSILSPARSRDNPTATAPPAQISLSSSLSRRLRSNGSLKGQASPMFPSGGGGGGKKRGGGAGFDNPEPSSPKVTCIGQVRVKTKKQGKKLRARSKRNGEVSFRKLELSRSGHHSFPPQNGNRNQGWVHFPETICEALRTFGSDWNCFLPCRSSCMSSSNKEEKAVVAGGSGGNSDDGSSSSCGAVIARWLVSVHEGEGGRGRRREIELVVGGEDIPTNERSGSQRRHIFEGLEFDEEEIQRERKEAEEGEEKGRVSICIPPKNALLLMRCRSDPVKMAALAKRFCESPVRKDGEDVAKPYEDVQKVVEEVVIEEEIEQLKEEVREEYLAVNAEATEEQTTEETESSSVFGEEEDEEGEEEEEQEVDQGIIALLPEESFDIADEKEEEDRTEILSSSGNEAHSAEGDEEISEEEEEEEDEATKTELLAENDNDWVDFNDESASTPPESDSDVEEVDEKGTETINAGEEVSPELEGCTEEEAAAERRSEPENPEPDDVNLAMELKGRDSVDREPAGLPDCLLLMMCEPKLSMEVSKETWVCSTDFVRWLPERHQNKAAAAGGDDPKKRAAATAAPNTKRTDFALTAQQARILQQPPRSSCSFPSQAAAMAAGAARRSNAGETNMAAMIEQKLLSAKAGEPLALTRCKSEPMRNAMKFAPDACFWRTGSSSPTGSRATSE